MLPALRLLLLTLTVLLISGSAAHAASRSLALPAEGQVAVMFASGVKGVKVKSAPAGVTVAGGVSGGRLAVAVIRPRGAAAAGKVVLTLAGKVKGVKTVAAALDGGKAPSCPGLDKVLAKRLKGTADVKGLAGVLAAKLCGKPALADAAAILAQLALGPAPAPLAPPPAPAAPVRVNPGSGGGTLTPPPGPGAKACANGVDDDHDGQTDLEDPGCADGGDRSEDSEVPVPASCVENNSGVGVGDDPTWLGAGINDCGPFTKVRIDIAPGIATCEINAGGPQWTCVGGVGTGPAVDTADVNIKLTGPVDCARPATIALYRPGGEVAELRGPIARCGTAKPACANGKDDDGDGMVDDHFADGATDPDPGCTSTTDTTEDSERPAPSGCTIDIGVWDHDALLAGAMTQGCGAIQGFWFRGPTTVLDCAYKLGVGGNEPCQKVGRTGGTMFAATPQDLRVAVELGQAVRCEPMTLALIMADHSVVAARDTLDGC